VRLWDTATGKELRRFDHPGVLIFSVAISTDGGKLAAGGDEKFLMVWDSNTGKELIRLDQQHELVECVRFSPDSKLLGVRSEKVADSKYGPSRIDIWDLNSGKLQLTLTDSDGKAEVAFSPDGSIVASGNDAGTITLWQSTTGKKLATLHGHSARVQAVAFRPEGKFLVSLADAPKNQEAFRSEFRVWNVQTAHEIARWSSRTYVNSMALSPDGRQLQLEATSIRRFGISQYRSEKSRTIRFL